MDATVEPEGRPVAAVDLEAGGRELEVVRLGQANEHRLMLSSRMRAVPIDASCVASPPSSLRSRAACRRLGGRPLVGPAADQDGRGGGPARRHRCRVQAPAAADAARPRRRARDALALERGARRVQLSGRRARSSGHDSRARRRARRLSRARRCGPLDHGCAPRRRPPAEGGCRLRDGRTPARPPLEPSGRAGHCSSSARTIRRHAPRRRTRWPGSSTSPAGSRTRSAPRPRRCSCRS